MASYQFLNLQKSQAQVFTECFNDCHQIKIILICCIVSIKFDQYILSLLGWQKKYFFQWSKCMMLCIFQSLQMFSTNTNQALYIFQAQLLHINRVLLNQFYLYCNFYSNLSNMGVQQSQSAQFNKKYNISPQLTASQPTHKENKQNYIAVVLNLSEQTNYSQLQSVIQGKIRCQSSYITKIFDKLESQSVKICSNHQRITVVYQQTGVNLAQLIQNRKKVKRMFTEQDIIYMIECVLRGINEFYKIGDTSQILTPSRIILDRDSKFKVIDPFLVATDTYSQIKGYNKEVQHIYGLKNKGKTQEIRKNQIRYKFSITQTQEKKVDIFSTSLFSLACISLSMLDFEFSIQYCFNQSILNKNLWQFDWMKFRSALKRIKNQNLKQKMWLLSSQYHTQRAQIFSFLNKNFENVNYPIDLLLKNTTFSNDLNEEMSYKIDKYSLTRHQIPLKQSITFIQRNSHPLTIKESDIKRPLTTISSTNNSQMCTQPLLNQQYSQTSHQSTAKVVFGNPILMKRSLPVSITTANNNAIYPPSSNLPYNNLVVRNSQIIKTYDCRKSHQSYHFQIIVPSIRSISSNNVRQPSLSQAPSHKSIINQLQDENLKVPLGQELYQSQKRIKALSELHEEQSQSIRDDKQDEQSEHSENVQKVDINQIFPGYHQSLSFQEQMSPISFIKNFQQPPLQEILLNGVIQEDSAENSMSEHSEVQIISTFVVEQYTNGGRYQGYKINQLREGYGKLYFANGQIYDGQWSKNKMHGFGKLFYDENNLVYEGYWKEDCFNGNGKLFNLDIKPMKSTCDFLNFAAYFSSWKVYQGEFIDDMKQGKGRLTFQNDEFYEGQFKIDKITGEGIFKGKNGIVTHGLWSDWKLVQIY